MTNCTSIRKSNKKMVPEPFDKAEYHPHAKFPGTGDKGYNKGIWLKRDTIGWICDTNDVYLKIGWGTTRQEAIDHCIKRNGL